MGQRAKRVCSRPLPVLWAQQGPREERATGTQVHRLRGDGSCLQWPAEAFLDQVPSRPQHITWLAGKDTTKKAHGTVLRRSKSRYRNQTKYSRKD